MSLVRLLIMYTSKSPFWPLVPYYDFFQGYILIATGLSSSTMSLSRSSVWISPPSTTRGSVNSWPISSTPSRMRLTTVPQSALALRTRQVIAALELSAVIFESVVALAQARSTSQIPRSSIWRSHVTTFSPVCSPSKLSSPGVRY